MNLLQFNLNSKKQISYKIFGRVLSVLLMFSILFASNASHMERIKAAALKGVVVTVKATSTVNVRSIASMSGTILCELYGGTEVSVLESTIGDDAYEWYKIECKHPATAANVTGYMRSDYVKVTTMDTTPDASAQTPQATPEVATEQTGTINARNVFVRKTAGTAGEYILSLYTGDAVAIKGQTTVDGNLWYHVTGTKSGVAFDGYVYGSYVSINVVVENNVDFETKLRTLGFPDSYISKLMALHAKYPKWEFVPVLTGLDWNTVITKESANGINMVPKTYDDSMKSTASGAYDWNTNTWTIYDGSSWVGANPQYIAYYMDPRNFLDDVSIFQFEALSYSTSHNLDGVKAVIGSSFLSKDVVDSDGTTLNYASTFMQIGQLTGVSPYHLAARVRQEQGAGTSSLISGKYAGYEGYYNYFNFGASGSGTTAVITSGLAYAKAQGWNTRYKSLYGGAAKISSNYISRGQDTLYFQKFNVVYQASLYGHQYMGNVIAAYSEGRNMANAYTDKQQAFVFRIPVYTNMPATNVTFTATGNPNNYLQSLTIAGQSLTPVFSGSQTEYSLIVPNAISAITVTAAPVAATSVVTGTGYYTLVEGNNTVQVNCKAQNGNIKTYTINVFRQEAPVVTTPTSNVPTSTTYTVGNFITGVTPGTTAATFVSAFTASGCTFKLLKADGTENTGVVATGNKLTLYNGGTIVAAYDVVVYGDVSGDGVVNVADVVKMSRHILGKSYLTGAYLEAGDANRKKDGINVVDLVVTRNHIFGTKLIIQ